VGFALPVNVAVAVYNSVIRTGRMSRGSIGITFRKYENNQQLLKGLGLKEGVIVESVNKGGPAEKGGIKPEDVIVAINGKSVKDGDDLVNRVSGTPIGDQVAITVDRNGKRVETKVTIGDREEQRAASDGGRSARPDTGESPEKPENVSAKFGVRIRPASDAERENSGLEKGGVVITTVDENSFADEIGLQEKDIIVSINRAPVASIDDVRSIQARLKAGDAVAFRVLRPSPVGQPNGRGTGQQRSGPSYAGLYVAGSLPNTVQ